MTVKVKKALDSFERVIKQALDTGKGRLRYDPACSLHHYLRFVNCFREDPMEAAIDMFEHDALLYVTPIVIIRAAEKIYYSSEKVLDK